VRSRFLSWAYRGSAAPHRPRIRTASLFAHLAMTMQSAPPAWRCWRAVPVEPGRAAFAEGSYCFKPLTAFDFAGVLRSMACLR
jgi:hypothetical protein